MIALKVPTDADHHPYQLVEILASSGAVVAKGDPVFKLCRAGSNRSTTFRAPVSGTIGDYLITVGADLLSAPGQHIVTLERAQSEAPSAPQSRTDAEPEAAQADRVEMVLPNDPELLPARIDAWLVNIGDTIALDQPIAQITLADGRQWDLTSKAAGRLGSIAAQKGEYITQMQRLCCTILQHDIQDARIEDPVDLSGQATAAPASEPPKKTAPLIATGPDVPDNYPMQLVEWHVEEGDFVGKGQVLMTLRRASGDASILRSIETGRIISRQVPTGTEFGISDVLYALSTAEKPPAGWKMPPDPPISTASPERAAQPKTAPSPAVGVKSATRENSRSYAPDAEAAAPEVLEQVEETKASNVWLTGFLILLGFAIATTYLFTGSRMIATAAIAVFLLVVLKAVGGPRGVAIGIVPVVFAGILMIAPQDIILPPVVTTWEPFVSSASSPDGGWHGDIWENITRPLPTKAQQARFDAWLEE